MMNKCLLGLTLSLLSAVARAEDQPMTPPSPLFYMEPTRKIDNPKPLGLKLEYGQMNAAGKSSFFSRNGKMSAKYENGLDELRLDLDSTYLKTSKQLVDDRRHYYLGYDRYVGARIWLFLLNDWESNEAAGLNYTQLTGGGFKFDIMRNTAYKLNVGIAYLKRAKQTEFTASSTDTDGITTTERRVSTKDDQVISARLKANYESDLWRWALLSFYQPVLQKNVEPATGEEKADFSWSIETSLAYNLSKKIYLKYAFNYRFEALRTAPGTSRQDEKTTLQLGYEF